MRLGWSYTFPDISPMISWNRLFSGPSSASSVLLARNRSCVSFNSEETLGECYLGEVLHGKPTDGGVDHRCDKESLSASSGSSGRPASCSRGCRHSLPQPGAGRFPDRRARKAVALAQDHLIEILVGFQFHGRDLTRSSYRLFLALFTRDLPVPAPVAAGLALFVNRDAALQCAPVSTVLYFVRTQKRC